MKSSDSNRLSDSDRDRPLVSDRALPRVPGDDGSLSTLPDWVVSSTISMRGTGSPPSLGPARVGELPARHLVVAFDFAVHVVPVDRLATLRAGLDLGQVAHVRRPVAAPHAANAKRPPAHATVRAGAGAARTRAPTCPRQRSSCRSPAAAAHATPALALCRSAYSCGAMTQCDDSVR